MITHNLCFEQKYEKSVFFTSKFSAFRGEIFYIVDRHVFVMSYP